MPCERVSHLCMMERDKNAKSYPVPMLNNLCMDDQRRFWMAYPEANEDVNDVEEDMGQEGMEVKIAFPSFEDLPTRGEFGPLSPVGS